MAMADQDDLDKFPGEDLGRNIKNYIKKSLNSYG